MNQRSLSMNQRSLSMNKLYPRPLRQLGRAFPGLSPCLS